MEKKNYNIEIFFESQKKSFVILSKDKITFDEVKSRTIKEFNIPSEYEKDMRFSLMIKNRPTTILNDYQIMKNFEEISKNNFYTKINFSINNSNMINTPELKQQNMINKYTPNPDNNINIIKNNNNNIQNQNQNKNHIIQSVQQLQNNNFIKNQHINNIISIEPVDNNQNQIKAKTNLRMPKLEPYSFPSSTEAAKTGLKNLGNTSYLNSVLQLLGSLHSYSSYFLNPKQGKFFQTNISKFPLCFVVHRLCTHLFPYKKEKKEKLGREIYAPESFLSVLGKFNSVYNDNETEKDPKLLIIYILDKLHQELNKEKNNNEENDSNTEINIKIACDRYHYCNSYILFLLFQAN